MTPNYAGGSAPPLTPSLADALSVNNFVRELIREELARAEEASVTPACLLVHTSGPQAIPSGLGMTTIAWVAATDLFYDTSSIFQDASDSIRIPETGLWNINAQVELVAAAGGGREARLFHVNGAFNLARINGVASATRAALMNMSAVRRFNAGDQIRLDVSQDSGGALNTGFDDGTFLSATRIEG